MPIYYLTFIFQPNTQLIIQLEAVVIEVRMVQVLRLSGEIFETHKWNLWSGIGFHSCQATYLNILSALQHTPCTHSAFDGNRAFLESLSKAFHDILRSYMTHCYGM